MVICKIFTGEEGLSVLASKCIFIFAARWRSKLKAVWHTRKSVSFSKPSPSEPFFIISWFADCDFITFLVNLQNHNWEPVFFCQRALAIEDQEYAWLSPLSEWWGGGLFFFLELSTLFLLMVSGLYKAVCKRSSQQKCKSRSSVTTTTTTCW